MSTSPSEPSPVVPPLAGPGLEPSPELEIDYDSLVTEDHKPVERIFIEKLYRLLTDPLYASWSWARAGRPFLVLANVGWFYQRKTPAVVPDCLLSLDVSCPEDVHRKQGHSYYQWDMGKPPDVIIEAVSDRTGGEESSKKNLYARLGVPHYAVFDPDHFLSEDSLRTYELAGGTYRLADPGPWSNIGLGLRLWEGKFQGIQDTWLRWCDANGVIIPTGEEDATSARAQARLAEEEASLARAQARGAEERARLAEEQLRELAAELRRLKGEAGAPPDGLREY